MTLFCSKYSSSTEDFQSSENTLYDTRVVDTCHHTLAQTSRMCDAKSDHNVNCGLWVIILYQCRSISCNQ